MIDPDGKAFKVLWVVWLLLALALMSGTVAVSVHFIRKYW